jgi:Ca-activated chloride channel family protein
VIPDAWLAGERLWLLAALPLLVVLYGLGQRQRRQRVVHFTNIALLQAVAPGRPGWRRHVVAAVFLCGVASGVVASARPYQVQVVQAELSGRVAIVLDVSLSMMATDVAPSRLAAAQQAAVDFVDQVDPGVQLSLISFSGQVRVLTPPTTDHEAVRRGIRGLVLGEGTAIGDALRAAVDVLVGATSAEGNQPRRPDDEVPGVIVLLSDGTTTVGSPTMDGAQVAADAGIPVSTIAFGTPGGIVMLPQTGELVPVPVDTVELATVAALTGGDAYVAPTLDSLIAAYDTIRDRLAATLGDPVEIPDEQSWQWVLAALVLLTTGWMASIWWVRSPL